MRTLLFCGLLCLTIAVFTSCSREESATAPDLETGDMDGHVDAELAAVELFEATEWKLPEDIELPLRAASPPGTMEQRILNDFEREVLVDDIVHYSFVLQIGNGPHEVIGIHRVVREAQEWQPIWTPKSIFFQHGCCKDFVGMYLPGLYSETTPDDFGIAVWLAQNDVDVWGIDQDWALAGAEVSGTGIMKKWGLDRAMSNIRTAMTIARTLRHMTGSGSEGMILSGYSNGVISTVGLLDYETQLPLGQRNITGYVPIDAPIKTDESDPLYDAFVPFVVDYYQPMYDAGVYEEESIFPPMAELVR